MAHDVAIAKAVYPDVPCVKLKKADGTGDVDFFDTSDATATKKSILAGFKAYVNGGMVTGELEQNESYTASQATATCDGTYVHIQFSVEDLLLLKKGAIVQASVPLSAFSIASGQVSLTADGWIGTQAPYTQVVNFEGITPTNDFIVSPRMEDATQEDLEAFQNSQVAATDQGDGTITFTAYGDKPSTTLDYNVKVLL